MARNKTEARGTTTSPGAPWPGPRRPSGSTLLNAGLLLLALLALVVITLRSEPDPGIEVERRPAPAGVDDILVHVRGAVAAPGVVLVQPGARVDDAIRLAGGALPVADLDAVNLALRLHDQDVVHVPAAGEGSPLLLDLNAASQAELEALTGIGPARAGAIISARPLAAVEDLVERNLVPNSVFEEIRTLVIVR